MKKEYNFKGKKVTIMGLGLHGGGLGVALFLARAGAHLTITDLKSKTELAPSIRKLAKYSRRITYVLGRHRKSDFAKADMVVKNPGVPLNSSYLKVAQVKGVPIESDIGLFLRLCPAKVLGITGTRGKSTITSLAYAILKKEDSRAVMGGNIRLSPLLGLKRINQKTPVILELSSWQLEDMAYNRQSPQVSVFISFYRDHLNRHKTMSAYLKAKKNIYSFQGKHDSLVLNHDQKIIKELKKEAPSQVYYFSLKRKVKGAYLQKGQLWFNLGGKKEKIVGRKELKITGEHNIDNALAAALSARLWGAKMSSIRSGLKNFAGLEDRQEVVRKIHGVTYVNDTTSTVPESTIVALEKFKKNIILIGGGADKELIYGEWAQAVLKHVKALILFKGQASDRMIRSLNRKGKKKIEITEVDTMKKAIKLAREKARSGDTVLLSPAAASFGLFVNEFDRGDQFRKIVKRMK